MKLQTIFDQLTFGELSQLHIGGQEAFGVTPDNHRQMVAHVNLGLSALHRRFFLREGRVALQCQADIDTYRLDPRFAESNTSALEPVQYLIDSASRPFRGDALKIERILDDQDQELLLNRTHQPR